MTESLSSHLGSRLMPTRPGLTVGVSRRFRSVACVSTDASPNEVRQTVFSCQLNYTLTHAIGQVFYAVQLSSSMFS